MSESIKFKNNRYLDSFGIVHNHESLNKILNKKPVIYVTDFAGILLRFEDARLYKMMMIKIIGNGYGGNPVDTIVQGYHYSGVGYFINCKQHNNSGSLPQCKFMIIDGIIALWIPTPGIYTSIVAEAYESIPTASQLAITLNGYYSEPNGSSKVACSIV